MQDCGSPGPILPTPGLGILADYFLSLRVLALLSNIICHSLLSTILFYIPIARTFLNVLLPHRQSCQFGDFATKLRDLLIVAATFINVLSKGVILAIFDGFSFFYQTK